MDLLDTLSVAESEPVSFEGFHSGEEEESPAKKPRVSLSSNGSNNSASSSFAYKSKVGIGELGVPLVEAQVVLGEIHASLMAKACRFASARSGAPTRSTQTEQGRGTSRITVG